MTQRLCCIKLGSRPNKIKVIVSLTIFTYFYEINCIQINLRIEKLFNNLV